MITVDEEYKQDIKKNIELCKKSIAKAPEGMLRIDRSSGTPRFYHRMDKYNRNGKYIGRKDYELARALAQKEYDLALINEFEKQLAQTNYTHMDTAQKCMEKVYSQICDSKKELIDKRFLTDEEYAAQWMSEEYRTLGFDINDKSEHYLEDETRVRSKSEILIGNALLYRKIPFKYEKMIQLANGEWLAPDFTCLNVRTRKVYIWEHLGKMGEVEYANKNVKKLEKYVINGYSVGDNVILTMETKEKPLNAKVMYNMIEQYLI